MPSVARLQEQDKSVPDHLSPNGEFMDVLENAVRQMLANRKTKPENRLAAITCGVKILAIKHKIDGGEVKGYFD